MRKAKGLIALFIVVLSVMFFDVEVSASILDLEYLALNISETYDINSDSEENLSFSSSNVKVVTVSPEGRIKAEAAGNATVIARSGNSKRYYRVNVKKNSLSVSPQNTKIYLNDNQRSSIQLKAKVQGTSNRVTWSTSDASIATVGPTGRVYAKGQGDVTITASANGVSSSCSVTVIPTKLDVTVNEVTVEAKGSDNNYTVVPYVSGYSKRVVWESSDKNIATVSSGKITGKSEGTAVITASANGISRKINVTVCSAGDTTKPVITINKTNLLLNSRGNNNKETLEVRVSGKNKSVNWKSSNAKVATVSSGVVTGKSAGTAVISATANGVTTYCTVEVLQTSISMPKTAELNSLNSESIVLNPVVSGTDSNITWRSANPAIATVENGVVTATGHGNVNITATANGVSAICKVVVNKPSVVLKSEKLYLYTGKGTGSYSSLNAKVVGNKKTVVWNSSNPAVASVNTRGKVEAVSEGTAVITATANGVSAVCEIEVAKTDLSIDKSELTLTKDYFRHSMPIIATVTGYSKTVTWKSTNTRVAKVVNGEVSAVSNGTAVITATANGITKSCIVEVTDTLLEDSVLSIDKTDCVLVCNSSVRNTVNLNACICGPTNETKWATSDATIATVDKNGKVTAKKKGTAIITVTANGQSAGCRVIVKEKKVILDKQSIVLNAFGENISGEIVATVENYATEDDGIIEYDEITWTSTNPGVAIVDEEGHVVAVNGGTCNIIASTSGIKAACKVTVLNNSIRLNTTDITLNKGKAGRDTYRLSATVTGTGKTVTWATSDAAVAIVDEAGNVTATGFGECIISAVSNGEEAICKVFVTGEEHVHNFVHESYSEVENICMDSRVETLKCEVCEAKMTTVIPAKGEHTYKTETKESECETLGYRKSACEICGHEWKIEEIPAKGHKESDWIIDVAATCTKKGSRHKECTVCGKKLTEGEMPFAEHEYTVAGETTPESPCLQHTYAIMKCRNCDASYIDYQNIIKEASHDYEHIVEDSTEENEGLEYDRCKVCNARANEKSIPKKTHEHVLEEEIIKDSTCVKTGEKKIYCKKCDYYTVETIERQRHHFGSPVLTKEATCSETGMMESKCVCGFIWYTKIPKTDTHVYEHYSYSTVSNPCVDTVVETFKCKNCTVTYTVDILPTGHDYKTVVVEEPTREKTGLKCLKCSSCGNIKEDSYSVIDKLEDDTPKECKHTSYTRTLTIPATCTNYATYKKTCNSCGVVIGIVEGTTLGEHDELIKKRTTAPTVNYEGEYSYICSACGKTVKTESIPKLTTCPHTGYDYTVDLGDGKIGVYCCSCNILLRIETNGNICTHKTTKQIMNTPPTSTTNGIVDVVCAECGKKMSTQTIHYYSTYTIDIGNGQTETVRGYFDDSKAQEVYKLLNQYRTEKGLNTLQWASKLESETRTRAIESAYLFSHQRPNGQQWWCLNSRYMNGENLAAGYTSPSRVMTGWKQSPGHNENMLAPEFESVYTSCFCRMDFRDDPNRLTPIAESYHWVQIFSLSEPWQMN